MLYWGELVVFIAMAWLLGRWAKSPLRFAEWLLLGLGLSTQSWFVFSLTAAWLHGHALARDWSPAADFARLRFNAVQVVLAAFTFVTILTLVFSGIRNGLLAQPDMHIAGTGGPYGGYSWFQDQTAGVLERPEHLLGADVGVSRAVLRVGELDGVRAGALAALGVQRVEGERPVARRNGDSPVPGNGAGPRDGCRGSDAAGSIPEAPVPATDVRYSQRPSR